MKIAVVLGISLIFAASALWLFLGRAQIQDIRADALQLHLEKYVSAGHHRSGGAGDVATRDWLARELGSAGFAVELQSVPFDQWHHQEAYLESDDQRFEGFPLWWPPKDPALQNVSGQLRLMSDAGAGDIGVMYVDPFLLASLKDEHREAITTAKENGLVGVIIITKTISGEPFAFNAEEEPADLAVLILGSRHADQIGQMIADERDAELVLRGEYRPSETWNVIGRLDRAGSEIVAVSTPRTGWFNCGAERGPGIALFVELAHWAARQGDSDLVFVATGGHEIGHIGMNAFIGAGAPEPENTANWVHLGASIAALEWISEEERLSGVSSATNTKTRWIIFSDNQTFSIRRHFYSLRYQFSPSSVAVFGEVKDIYAAGYERFFGFAGGHPYFHLPSDDADNTSGEMLVPVAHAIQEMMLSSL